MGWVRFWIYGSEYYVTPTFIVGKKWGTVYTWPMLANAFASLLVRYTSGKTSRSISLTTSCGALYSQSSVSFGHCKRETMDEMALPGLWTFMPFREFTFAWALKTNGDIPRQHIAMAFGSRRWIGQKNRFLTSSKEVGIHQSPISFPLAVQLHFRLKKDRNT